MEEYGGERGKCGYSGKRKGEREEGVRKEGEKEG